MNRSYVPRWVRFFYLKSNRTLHRIDPNENALLLTLACVVGVASGFGAILFEWMIHMFFEASNGIRGASFFGTFTGMGNILILVLGGLIGGVLIHTIAKGAKGHGIPDVMYKVAIRGGRVRPRVVGDTSLAAGVCLGAGGSAGPEGPIVQIGSGIGSAIGQAIRMSSDRLRVLTACGAAGGISAIFGAPLAGVMFAVEVILGDFTAKSLTALVVASVLAASTHQAFVRWEPLFHVPRHEIFTVEGIPIVALLGVAAGLLSFVFIRTLYFTEDRFEDLPIPGWVKPATGMALVGVVAMWFPQVLGDGYHNINDALNGRLVVTTMIVLVGIKLVATVLTVGSGNVGGLFAPALMVGAMLGGAFGGAAHTVFPAQAGSAPLYVLVGMAALVAGTTHATITSILLVFELTNDYSVILPVMLASAASVVVAMRLERQSIYSLKLMRQGIHLSRGVEVNVMASIKVEDVMRDVDQVVHQDLHFNQLMDTILNSTHNTFPVVNDDDRLVAVITYGDLRGVLAQDRSPEMDALVLAGDIATHNPEVVTPDQNLNEAMKLFGRRDLSVLPVVDSKQSRKLVGKLHRIDVLNAYRRALTTEPRA